MALTNVIGCDRMRYVNTFSSKKALLCYMLPTLWNSNALVFLFSVVGWLGNQASEPSTVQRALLSL